MTRAESQHAEHVVAENVTCQSKCEPYCARMSASEILEQILALPSTERRDVVGKIWEEFADAELPLTDAQARELDRRLQEHARRPDDVVAWAEIKAATEAKHGRRHDA